MLRLETMDVRRAGGMGNVDDFWCICYINNVIMCLSASMRAPARACLHTSLPVRYPFT